MLVHSRPAHSCLDRTRHSQSRQGIHRVFVCTRPQSSCSRARCRVQCYPNSGSSQRQVQARCRATDDVETQTKQTGLRLPAADVQVLERASAAWHRLCTQGPTQPPAAASQLRGPAPKSVASEHYDVLVLGGTLGILLATALLAANSSSSSSSSGGGSSIPNSQRQQLRVAVVERGVLVGRDQEWNCSQGDLQVLVDLGVLTAADVSSVVVTRIPSVRVGVAGVCDITLSGLMDVGVSPKLLLDTVKRRFLELGGDVLEHTSFQHLTVYDDCAHLQLSQQQQCQQQSTLGHSSSRAGSSSSDVVGGAASGGAGGRQADFETLNAAISHGQQQSLPAPAPAAAAAAGQVPLVLSAAVVVDALGSFSPLSAQARGQAAPEAAMLLVGSCVDTPSPPPTAAKGSQSAAAAAPAADLLWGMDAIDKSTCQQYWWERFPADGGSATTSYMFTFSDPAPDNKDLLPAMMRVYEKGLQGYLGVPADQLSVRRGVFGYVPCYSERVLPLVDRLLPVGDSAANRSALSLAGFCALLRHLGRITAGLREALDVGATTKQELSLLQPWCPGVTATTAMQRTMSVYSNQFQAVRTAAATAADIPRHQQQQQLLQQGPLSGDGSSSTSSSSGAPPDTAVLSVMGASLAAMWDAVGEEGMRPFVADRIQLAPLAASMATQLRRDARQLVEYSVFLGDTRGASRLLKGLAGLWLYGLLHSATPLTGPLHETLLAGSPRLLYRWHRYTDAWRYGRGADWQASAKQPQQQQQQQQHQQQQQQQQQQ